MLRTLAVFFYTKLYVGTTGETRRRKTTGPEMAASCTNAICVVPAQAINVWAFLLYIEGGALMFFERLFKKKEGQTIERVEAPPIETTKNVDTAAKSVLITDEQKHDHDFRLTLTGLEQRLHTSENNEEIIMEAIKTACDFYEAEMGRYSDCGC